VRPETVLAHRAFSDSSGCVRGGFWKEHGKLPHMAIMTSSRAIRGAMTALSWFMPDVFKAFAPSDWSRAAAYLGLSVDQIADIARETGQMQAEVMHMTARERAS
jgi:hypothetical protein